MNIFRSAPFVRILPAFILGIIVTEYASISIRTAAAALFASVFALILTIRMRKSVNRFWSGIVFQIFYLGAGWLITCLQDDSQRTSCFANFPASKEFILQVENEPVTVSSGLRTMVDVVAIKNGFVFIPTSGKAFFYFKEDSSVALRAGDLLLTASLPAMIQTPANPGQFDFKKYCANKGIYYQFRSGGNQFVKFKNGSELNITRLAEKLRDDLLNVYRKAGIAGEEYSVLSALVLGYDDEIDRRTMQAFAASGTLHILSVSGMHVGLVYGLLSLLFKRFEERKALKWFRYLFIVIFLWFYAMVTGLSPSVIRSAMMFTLLLTGKLLRRDSNIYNTLCASVLIICLSVNTKLIFDVGFQLSYIAVAGISYLYPLISRRYIPVNYLSEKTWPLIAASLAAQIASFPITLFYFHQFPNYFLIANLLIIPLSTIAIFAGLTLLILEPFTDLLKWGGWLTGKLVFLLNHSAEFISNLPYSVTQSCFLTLAEMVILYLLMIFICRFLLYRNLRDLKLFLISSIVLIACFSYRSYRIRTSNEIVFFSGTKQHLVALRYGDQIFGLQPNDSCGIERLLTQYSQSVYLSDSRMLVYNYNDSSKSKLPFFVQGNNIFFDHCHLKIHTTIHGKIKDEFFSPEGKRYLILSDKLNENAGKDVLSTHYTAVRIAL